MISSSAECILAFICTYSEVTVFLWIYLSLASRNSCQQLSCLAEILAATVNWGNIVTSMPKAARAPTRSPQGGAAAGGQESAAERREEPRRSSRRGQRPRRRRAKSRPRRESGRASTTRSPAVDAAGVTAGRGSALRRRRHVRKERVAGGEVNMRGTDVVRPSPLPSAPVGL